MFSLTTAFMRPYIVTKTDYFGKDYQATVLLTDKQARERIVDGRLTDGNNYNRLWDQFKEISKETKEYRDSLHVQYGSAPSAYAYEQNQIKEQIKNEEI